MALAFPGAILVVERLSGSTFNGERLADCQGRRVFDRSFPQAGRISGDGDLASWMRG